MGDTTAEYSLDPFDSVLADVLASKDRDGALADACARFPDLAPRLRAKAKRFPFLESNLAAIPADLLKEGRGSPVAPHTRFGRYELGDVIGKGGQGVVYEARDSHLVRVVALKVLSIQAGRTTEGTNGHWSHDQIEQFLREAQTAAGLHHTNIVPIFDFGNVSGIPYYTMQRIDGRTIKSLIEGLQTSGAPAARADRRKHVRRAAWVGVQVADALQYAHGHDFIHGDLSPANLMLDDQENAWVTDFGLTRGLGPGAAREESRGGTLAYMAPEQWRDGARDQRTDIYGLGATLFELIALRKPYDGRSPNALLKQFQKGPPPRLDRLLRRSVPGDLAKIVARALAHDPEERYQSAGAMASDLRAFVEGRPPGNPGPVRYAFLWSRLHLRLTFAVSLLIATLAGYLLWSDLSVRASRAAALASEYSARLSKLRLLRQVRPEGWYERAENELRALSALEVPGREPLEVRTELRREAVACMLEPRVEPLYRLSDLSKLVWSVDFDADGKRLVTADRDGGVSLFELKAEGPVASQIDKGEPGPEAPVPFGRKARRPVARFRPGGGLAFTTHDNRVVIQGPGAGAPTCTIANHGIAPRGLSWAPDGQRLAVGWADGTCAVYRDDGGTPIRLFETATRPPRFAAGEPSKEPPLDFSFSPRFSPDGKRIAVPGATADEVRVCDVADGRSAVTFKGPAELSGSPVFSPDGKSLVVGSIDAIYVFDVPSARLIAELSGPGEEVIEVAFNPEGDLLASVGFDRTLRVWQLPTNQVLLAVKPNIGSLYAVAFAADGQRLAVGGDYGASVYRLGGRGIKSNLARSDIAPFGLAFDAGGGALAVATDTGKVVLHDIESGAEIRRLAAYNGPAFRVTFDPSGALLAAGPSTLPDRPSKWESGPPEVPELPPMRPSEIAVWDARTGAAIRRIAGHQGDVTALAFSTAGRRLASATADGTVLITESATGRVTGRLQLPEGAWVLGPSVAFLDDGETLVVADFGGKIDVAGVNALTSPRYRRVFPRGVARIAVSPDRARLAFSHYDGSVEVLRLPDLATVATLNDAHAFTVVSLAFSGDGALLATGDLAGNVVLWQTAGYQRICTLPGQEAQVNDLAFDHSGGRLAIADNRSGLILWDLRKLRPTLQRLGLSWEPAGWRPSRPVTPRSREAPLTRRGLGPIWMSIPPKVVARFLDHCLEVDPDQVQTRNDLAWLLAAGPQSVHDARRALELARTLPIDDPVCRNTLAAAHYYRGDYANVLLLVERPHIKGRGDRPYALDKEIRAFDTLFRILALHALGQREKAQALYDEKVNRPEPPDAESVESEDPSRPQTDGLRWLQAEDLLRTKAEVDALFRPGPTGRARSAPVPLPDPRRSDGHEPRPHRESNP